MQWEGSGLGESRGVERRVSSEEGQQQQSGSLGVLVCRVERAGGDGSKALGLHLP